MPCPLHPPQFDNSNYTCAQRVSAMVITNINNLSMGYILCGPVDKYEYIASIFRVEEQAE
jgi:hypothetical protein